MFIWLGDAAYLDDMIFPTVFKLQTNVTEIRRRFDNSKYDVNYDDFRKSTQIIGVYDDHDFGINNGDGSNPMKQVIKQEYLNFLEKNASDYDNINGLYYSYSI